MAISACVTSCVGAVLRRKCKTIYCDWGTPIPSLAHSLKCNLSPRKAGECDSDLHAYFRLAEASTSKARSLGPTQPRRTSCQEAPSLIYLLAPNHILRTRLFREVAARGQKGSFGET